MDAQFRVAQILAILLFAEYHLCFAQVILDRAPSGRSNEVAIAGGSRRVEIETNVPLSALIQRLKGNWELEETGKAYWIGYTKDMYSIARYGDQAVGPLVELIRNTSSGHAREGALLSLHLIGIKSRIVGRFNEEFSSKSVREAFYDFLEDDRLRDEVLLLLVRDPWPSDVPHLMRVLARESDTNCQPTVNALFRYALNCPAFGGTLAKDASAARVSIVEGERTTEIGRLVVFTEEQPNEDVARINQLNSSYKDIVIQWRLDGGRKVWKFADPEAARKTFAAHYKGRDVCEVVYDALRKDDFTFRYCSLLDPFNFQVSGTNVYIIDPPAAKERWLEWWKKQSDQQKSVLGSSGNETANGSQPVPSEAKQPSVATGSEY